MTLLDTNILLWLFAGSNKLSLKFRSQIEQDPAGHYVSDVSIWEIATKRSIGKLEIDLDIPTAVKEQGLSRLRIDTPHIYAYEDLPLLHRDPFDRMLVAQAKAENMYFMTGDTALPDYGIKLNSI